ncbi:4'-phosphopantetheinyl transferase family protein [Halomonas sp. TG39a]|uniref:4'-phosphopantetheinyl transferase family protein n=1 Tax=Halomonas sp. TG39a TaxID=1415755 RepID=UPI00054DEB50|nr:4'-phosphopantetheinyl transferase superfamily protein [Halomonas sp. TG39a]
MGIEALESLLIDHQEDWPEWLTHSIGDPANREIQPIFPIEEEAIALAVEKRRAEFAAGRSAAREALAKMGYAATAIPMGKDRAPIWPFGVVGSITHTASVCLAVTASTHRVLSVGVDVENLISLDNSLISQIAKPNEIELLSVTPEFAALRIFSMKEAAYKAQYMLSRTFLDFEALEVTKDGLRFRNAVSPFPKGFVLPMLQWIGFGLCLSLCVLPPAISIKYIKKGL